MTNSTANKQTIRLELLRHGSTHGQLLSPGTPYLALCGNHGVHGFNVPVEHMDYLIHREWLRYRGDEVSRETALRNETRVVSQIFAAIPALAGELKLNATGLIHIRLILSAAELAVLPFEMAAAPPGSPTEGLPLLLDGSRQVVLTREARRVSPLAIPWPDRPRILFVCATPDGTIPLPIEAHMLALRGALDPWIGWKEGGAELQSHITVITNASLREIERVCRVAADDHKPFTHVHVLAHGIERPVPGTTREMRHYLALCRDVDSNEADAVDGRRLEAALRPNSRARGSLAVVTLASCDSGDGGSILPGGASIAHELHESGIPFVVASQFPLTYYGSVIMAERLYNELLRGTDPVLALLYVRRELYGLGAGHDWASLVAYAALPVDIDAQILAARYQRTKRAGDVALARAARARRAAPSQQQECAALEQAISDMEAFTLEPTHAADAHGWLGSIGLRWAEAVQNRTGYTPASEAVESRVGSGVGTVRLSLRDEAQALSGALRCFERAFEADRRKTWALVQALTLRWVLERTADRDAWSMARQLCMFDQSGAAYEHHDSMAQICLLSPAVGGRSVEDATRDVVHHLSALISLRGEESYEVFTARRQIRRHAEWWNKGSRAAEKKVRGVAQAVLKQFTAHQISDKWHER